MISNANDLLAKDQIIAVLNRYAQMCDRRDWALGGAVFAADVQGNYGGVFQIKSREKLLQLIRSSLGGCGPSQHLLGNYCIAINGNTATNTCYVRAAHAGKGSMKDKFYEIWGEYKDKLAQIDGAWKITHRELWIYHEIGTRDVLVPEQVEA